MWQVDNVIGMQRAAERIKAYEAKYGGRWKIAPLIDKAGGRRRQLCDAGGEAQVGQCGSDRARD